MDYLKQERRGTGGLVLMASTIILTIAMCFTTALCRVASARDIVENVENTVALQCLSSCYIGGSASFAGNTSTNPDSALNTYKKVVNRTKNGNNIFTVIGTNGMGTDILHQYGLLEKDKSITSAYVEYNKAKKSFTLQFAPIKIGNYKVLGMDLSTITPEPATVSIENS